MGVNWYATEISKVAAKLPGGRDKITTVMSNVPHAIGKLSKFIP